MTGATALIQLLIIGRSPALQVECLRPVWNSACDSGKTPTPTPLTSVWARHAS